MNKSEVAKLLAFITATYPNVDVRDGTVEAWHSLLHDIPFEFGLAAVKNVLLDQEYPSMPAVGKIRKEALTFNSGHEIPSAGEAWGEVMRELTNGGLYYNRPHFSHSSISKSVQALGSNELCHSENIMADRAHFFKIYETYQGRAEREVCQLPEVKKLKELTK